MRKMNHMATWDVKEVACGYPFGNHHSACTPRYLPYWPIILFFSTAYFLYGSEKTKKAAQCPLDV